MYDGTIGRRVDTVVTLDGHRCAVPEAYATLDLLGVGHNHWGRILLPLTGELDKEATEEAKSSGSWSSAQCMIDAIPAGSALIMRRPEIAVFAPRIPLVIDTNLLIPLHAIVLVGLEHAVRIACVATLEPGQTSLEFHLEVCRVRPHAVHMVPCVRAVCDNWHGF